MRERPNILVIMTDQQSAHMMSCTGNRHLNTPALDRLAESGIRFDKAYCSNPVCVPSRFSLQTGRMPSSINMRWNEDLPVPESIINQSLGAIFQRAGYESVYGGKVHLPGDLKHIETNGYKCLTADARQGLADACSEFLKREHDEPFFLFASFVNPHDICYLAINDALKLQGKPIQDNADSQTCELIADRARATDSDLPPLPDNHEIGPSEPGSIDKDYLSAIHAGVQYRRHAREVWGDREWQVFREVYRKLTEQVDAEIGQVLDALREASLEENTLVVFTSDHGDMDGAHKLQHKSVLYDEAARVPFVMRWKGVLPEGVVDSEHLVSNGLDLLPTLCDTAGIECPAELRGTSLLPIARGDSGIEWRDHLVVESKRGRMVHTSRHKYCIYESGTAREQLFEMDTDPGEMTDLTGENTARAVLASHRRLLEEWTEKTDDSIGQQIIGQQDTDGSVK